MHNLTRPEIRIQQCQYSAIWITADNDDDTKAAATVITYFVIRFQEVPEVWLFRQHYIMLATQILY